MGQTVILLKTIQGILRERQRQTEREEDEWEERQIRDDTERERPTGRDRNR